MVEGCQKCGACCHNHTVLITPRDLREIHQFYPSVDLMKIISILTPVDQFKDPDNLLSHYPLIEFKAANPEEPLLRGYLALKFEEISAPPQRTTRCIFFSPTDFVQSDNTGCAIHEHKPLICRSYPFQIQEDSSIVFHGTRCPHNWGFLSDKESMELQKLLVIASRAYEEFFAEFELWDELKAPKKDIDFFLEFILTNH
jgi:Fe-S-cluster containining protein